MHVRETSLKQIVNGLGGMMPSKSKQKASTNALDNATLTTNEKILKECYQLYTDEDTGLTHLADTLGIHLQTPRKKIQVMLIGNHSAGKSSFINWYIEEHVQKTGVAIETQGFSFITSGKRRESLTGNATLHLYPHYNGISDLPGLIDYLSTEISCSKQKKFPLVTFIDTPGLVDGGMKYPFNVDEAILWFGERADLIFVFFDPIGQALCKRTINIVEQLNINHGDRLRFYLSKADEAGHESDRQRVMMQIVQELCKRPGLNKTCFDMPTIYIPNPNKTVRCANQIDEVCRDVEKTIDQTIQNTLNHLGRDCQTLIKSIDIKLEKDVYHSKSNLNVRVRSCGLLLCSVILPILPLILILLTTTSRDTISSLIGHKYTASIRLYMEPITNLWSGLEVEVKFYATAALFVLALLLVLLARYTTRIQPRLSKREKRRLMEQKEYLDTVIMTKRQSMYKEYLQQSAGDFSDL